VRLLAVLSCLVPAAPLYPAAADLAKEPSAFLQAQAGSPVNWSPWSAEAFARAQQQKKPVMLAIGTFTSELSRAMARQSFANADTGKFLNEQFVAVIVDAKERPDVAALYQNYLQIVKQVSGPPMNLWLTPDLKPFEGANYLPPTEEWGKEGFVTVTKRIAAAWTADAAAQARKADEAVAAVAAALPTAPAAAATPASIAKVLSEAGETWKARFDATNGGFGDPPKYAEPELLRFLLVQPATREMAVTTLRAIVRSPVRDALDGGFFRYGTDAAWHQPYFQKLLADQPRMALALLDAAKVTKDAEFAEAARGALKFALHRLALAGGEYVAAEDGTGEELTGSYLWTLEEIRTALGEKDAGEFAQAFGVTAAGNLPEDAFPGQAVKGKNVLFRSGPPADAATEGRLAASAAKLLQVRAQRPAARRDDGATSGAHGLLLAALARAGDELGDKELAAAARAEATFIERQLQAKAGGLLRLSGRTIEAAPADYALVIDGLLTFAEHGGTPAARKLALALVEAVNAHYWDAKVGRYFAVPAAPQPGIWARVYSPAPSAGDPPAAEPAMLLALQSHKDVGPKDQSAALAGTLVADAGTATDPVRGDALLALQAAAAQP
jgi:uncharacterized protein YyaL (SSP411 family)